MDITLFPGNLSGEIAAVPSKSMAHRLLICAAFADAPTTLLCPETNRDIDATADCLRALGAGITRTEAGYTVTPVKALPKQAVLPCRESGSTLRFLLPVAAALGVDVLFQMEGRLPDRPVSPLWEELERMGCSLSRPTADTIRCTGRLQPGRYSIDGSISSQFVSGLLFAQALIEGESSLTITGPLESRPYVEMTKQALAIFHAPRFRSPGTLCVEGDWSSAAFWLASNALGSNLTVTNLNPDSLQGDKAAADLIPALREHRAISAADIPDLIPALSIVAACNRGAVFTDIRRLRLKESDRVAAIVSMITALGGRAEATENTLTVHGTGLTGGTVDPRNDHRIAMAAAIASTACAAPVTILNAECVSKSYPQFWADFARLGGKYELNLR